MRKSYAYLLFALFFAFSACQEEDVQSTVEEDIEEVEPTTFTFIYKGKTFLETRHSKTDPIQNKTIEDVLSSNAHSVYEDSKKENTYYLFDDDEEAKKFFNVKDDINAAIDCNAYANLAILNLYRDKNFYAGRLDRSSGNPYQPRYDFNALWQSYGIDNSSGIAQFAREELPCDLYASSIEYDNEATSVALVHLLSNPTNSGVDVAATNRRAVAILYIDRDFKGRSFVLVAQAGSTSAISDLSKTRFYDFFGIKYGPTYNDKISSVALYFSDDY